MPQLILSGIATHDDATFANFLVGPNKQLLKCLQTVAAGRGDHFVYLWGSSGMGRSHLLHACNRTSRDLGLMAFYISLEEIAGLNPEIFENLELMHLVCVDDLQGIAGKPEWEEAFFDFFNRMHDACKRLVVSANTAPDRVGIKLPDLVSRLSAGLIYPIRELTDDEKLEALMLRAHQRSLTLPVEVAQFLWRRWPRDTHSLFAALDTLDKASLEAQRRLTIPFAKLVLGL